jgi:hypothetical protein
MATHIVRLLEEFIGIMKLFARKRLYGASTCSDALVIFLNKEIRHVMMFSEIVFFELLMCKVVPGEVHLSVSGGYVV